MNNLTYASLSKNFEPNKLVLRALEFLKNKDIALDIGSGSLRDSKFLAESGFKKVIAIDKENIELSGDRVEFIQTKIQEYVFSKNYFDLVIAINSLPFLNKDEFDSVFPKIKEAVKIGGIICITLFGINDEWAIRGKEKMNFHTKEEILTLLKDWKIKIFTEEEKQGKTIDGKDKYWHIFRLVAEK